MTPDTCEAGKETTTALMKILSFGGGAASTVQERDAGLFQTGNVTLVRHNLQNPS